jgi:hypothetical protein
MAQAVSFLSRRRPGFTAGSIHVGIAVDEVALGQVFLQDFGSSVNIISPWISIFMYHLGWLVGWLVVYFTALFQKLDIIASIT